MPPCQCRPCSISPNIYTSYPPRMGNYNLRDTSWSNYISYHVCSIKINFLVVSIKDDISQSGLRGRVASICSTVYTWWQVWPLLTHLCSGVTLESVVCIFDTIEDKLEMKNGFMKSLKESCWYRSDYHFSFKYLHIYDVAWKISPISSGCFCPLQVWTS